MNIEERAKELLSRMTFREKLKQMYGIWGIHAVAPFTYILACSRTSRNKRLGIPAFRFTDGPRGINLGRSTCFPVPMARGATWDTGLEERIGRAIGEEARHQGANSAGSTCVNILRHPGWGRAQETFGADPVHLGELGAAHVRGQKDFVMPVVKHLACNSIELSRFKVNITIDERSLREIYLPHFRRSIEAGAASVMTAYNKVNGFYCGENRHLIKDILKGDWGFDGFVISDWFLGCKSTVPSLNAGLDIEMPQMFYYTPSRVRRAIRSGKVKESVIDEAVLRILRQKIRFGLLDTELSRDRKRVACTEHTDLALEAARKSMVLLKNDGSFLPIRKSEIKKIAVIGNLARKPNLGSKGSTGVTPPWAVTPLQGLKGALGDSVEILYASGRSLRRSRALRIARDADAVILVTGLTQRDEGEYFPLLGGGDRPILELGDKEEKLITDIAAVNKNCAVVLVGGSAICMDRWIGSVKAVLMAWYAGMQGGKALADILLGDINPSGKLPITIPKSSDQLPFLDVRAEEVTYDYWHDYRYFDRNGREPGFPFGFGLSYTAYRYSGLRLKEHEFTAADKINISVDVENTGNMAGEEIAQVYVAYNGSAVERPKKELKAFTRVALEAGEKKTVTMEIPVHDLAYYDTAAGQWTVEKIEYEILSGPSSADLPLRARFRVR